MPETAGKPKDTTVGCKISKEKKAALERIAEEEGESVSALVREAIKNRLVGEETPDE